MDSTTPIQAATLLGLSRYAVWKAIERGVLQASRDAETRRYSVALSEVERYRREHLGRRGPRPGTKETR